MHKYLSLLSFILLFSACDDGDVITAQLDFDDTFQACGQLVFFQTKDTPAESLSLKIGNPSTTINDILEYAFISGSNLLVELENPIITGDIDGTSHTFNYSAYNTFSDNLFCNDIPPSDLDIAEDYSSNDGSYTITTVLTEDDNDGIPAELEDINMDGNLDNDDTDQDGLPNYLDADDDGDNVLTKTELQDLDLNDNDDDPLTDPEDTDNDGIPNYLDNDDDNDGVNTIDEENNTQDLNPANDFTNPQIADYLNPAIANTVTASAYRTHSIQQTYKVGLVVNSISFSELINQDVFDFGFLNNSATTKTRTVTPSF